MRRIILTNFKRDDIYLTLTYADEPESYWVAKSKISKFLRAMRRKYRKAGKELKYIYTTESRGKRIHHHLLLNYEDGLCTSELVQECWKERPLSPKGMELYEVINTYTNEGYPLQIARFRKRGRQNE